MNHIHLFIAEVGIEASHLGKAVDEMTMLDFPVDKEKNNVLFILTDGLWTYDKKTVSDPKLELRSKMAYVLQISF